LIFKTIPYIIDTVGLGNTTIVNAVIDAIKAFRAYRIVNLFTNIFFVVLEQLQFIYVKK